MIGSENGIGRNGNAAGWEFTARIDEDGGFARALGEYGATSMIAGYTPGKTATISTTVYQLWQTNNDVLATKWVLVNIAISAVVLLAVNMLERRDFLTDASKARRARR